MTGGTVAGLVREFGGGPAWEPAWSITDLSYGAASLAQAVATAGRTDDALALRQMLAGADTSNLSAADDWVRGFGGKDTIAGYRGDDQLAGDGGNDRLLGGVGADTLLGGSGADRLLGGAGDDVLLRGDGGDVLTVGACHDILRGGLGRDIFDFNAFTESGPFNAEPDMIDDFARGMDKIDPRSLDADVTVDGDQAFSRFIGSGTFNAPGPDPLRVRRAVAQQRLRRGRRIFTALHPQHSHK